VDPASTLQRVLAPIRIGSESARNRIGLAPLNTGLVSAAGLPNERFVNFHELYASAQVGIVFVGGVAVCSQGRASAKSAVLERAEAAKSIEITAARIRSQGALPIIQLMHAGRQANPSEIGSDIVAPSPIPCPVIGIKPHELSRNEIVGLIDAFINSASLAKKAGFTTIELHAAHGYLLGGFLSPYSNKRTDEYGGSAERRRRLLELIVREALAIDGLQVGVRISADEFVPDGLAAQHIPETVRAIQSGGACYVSVSAGVYDPNDRIMPPRTLGEAVYRSLGAAAKAVTKLPVMLAGNITNLASADDLIVTCSADVVLMGRALLADPFLIPKTLTRAEVQPCTMSLLCKYHSRGTPHIACPHNKILAGWLRESIRNTRRKSSQH
jgi:2,4-dienoyl-CoA reductase-like NADH-dependent reductase (Old Yellow Enzyme family)